MSRDDERRIQYLLHSAAVYAACLAAGLPAPDKPADDPWWDEGPHVEKDGRRYYVHARGCLYSQLGQAMQDHPDWYLIGAVVQGRRVQIRGLDDVLITLGEIQALSATLSADEMRLAIELTPAEKRELWGVRDRRLHQGE
jgi:hypothetical protein